MCAFGLTSWNMFDNLRVGQVVRLVRTIKHRDRAIPIDTVGVISRIRPHTFRAVRTVMYVRFFLIPDETVRVRMGSVESVN
jgi:hypothetical protein